MSDTNSIRTNIYLPKKLYEKMKQKKGNRWLSNFVKQQLEYELYNESPDFIRRKIEEIEQQHQNDKNLYLAKLKVAEESQKKKKEQLGTMEREVNLYRTIIPPKTKSKKEGDK
ncbi:MAG: hypothetical protein IMZ63_01925 [Actinobacteria bacterium]|nr:hypothetical protein [Actinomycetota bacterium]